MNWTRRLLSFSILTILTISPALYVWSQLPSNERFISRRVVYLGTTTSANGIQVEIRGVFGNLFRPREARNDMGFDLVAISCYFDPLSLDGRDLLPVNPLLASAIAESINDPLAVKDLLANLLFTLEKSRAVVNRYMLSKEDRPSEGDKIVPHIWVSVESAPVRKKHGVKYMAALPLFDPHILRTQDTAPSIVRGRLGENVEAAIRRLLNQCGEELDGTVHSVAFAATGSTSHKGGDSPYFLEFSDGFLRTVRAIQLSRPPLSLDRIYLVAFDQHTGQYRKDALSGLRAVSRYFILKRIETLPILSLLGGGMSVGLTLLVLMSYQNVGIIWRRQNRWNLIRTVLAVSVVLGASVSATLRIAISLLPPSYVGLALWLSALATVAAYLAILLLSKRLSIP